MSTRKDDNIRLNFIINGDPARKQLNQLDKEARELNQSLKGMKKGTEDYINTSKRLTDVKNKQQQLRKEIGISALNIRELNAEAKKLRLMKSYLIPGTEKFKEVDKRLGKVTARLKELRYGTKQSGLSLSKMADGFNKYVGVIAGATASFAGIIMGARRAVEEFNTFEQKMANLSALTGLVGEDLQYLGNEAADMATSVMEGNVRITQSADSIVDAFTKVGSQRPELLKNKEALAAVTKDALILAEAGNMELAPAVEAVTTTLNQMRLEASESSRVINAIAAGSKEGAADVPYLTQAMEKSGTTARLMGMSVEKLVGAVETVAPFYKRAEMAGNSLDKVLLRMRANNIGYVDGVFSMESALQELETRFSKGETAVDIFGVEHAKMAEVLVQNQDEFNRYTQAVTGSNVAIEQAATNTDTNLAKLEQARNRYKENLRELGGMLAPVMTFSTNTFSYIMKTILQVVKNYDLYRDILLALIATYAAYNAQLIITKTRTLASAAAKLYEQSIDKASLAITKSRTIATNLFALAKAKLTGNTIAAANAQKALRAVMASTPWGAVLAAVTAIGAALVVYFRNQNRVTDLQKAQKAINEQVTRQYDEQAATIIRLSSVIENGNLPLGKRKEAIEQLKDIMPEYNGYLDEEGKLHKHSADQIELYLESLKKKLYMNAMEGELQDLIKKQVEAQRELTAATERYNNALANTEDYRERSQKMHVLQGESMAKYAAAEKQAKNNLDAKTEAMTDLDSAIQKITSDYESLLSKMDDTDSAASDTSETISDAKDNIQNLSGELDLLATRIKNAEEGINSLSVQIRNAYFKGDVELAFDLEKDRAALAAHKQALEATNFVISGAIEMKGSPQDFLDSLDDTAFLEEEQQRLSLFQQMWGNPEELENGKEQLVNSLLEANSIRQMNELEFQKWKEQKDQEARERELNQERKKAEEIKQLQIDILQSASSAIFSIAANNRRHDTDVALQELNRQREAELDNENLTQEQKDAINEKYRKKEAAIKREEFKKNKKAAIIESIINTALAVVKALPNVFASVAAGVAGAAQTAVIAAQPVPQFAKGKYQVTGNQDGKSYHVPYIGSPTTGIINQPALISEKGPELIIDAPTTKNLQLNYPDIMQGIMQARVPQYATGKMPEPSQQTATSRSQAPKNNTISPEFMETFMIMLDRSIQTNEKLSSTLSKGINAKLSLFDLDNMTDKRNNAENETSY